MRREGSTLRPDLQCPGGIIRATDMGQKFNLLPVESRVIGSTCSSSAHALCLWQDPNKGVYRDKHFIVSIAEFSHGRISEAI